MGHFGGGGGGGGNLIPDICVDFDEISPEIGHIRSRTYFQNKILLCLFPGRHFHAPVIVCWKSILQWIYR